MRSAQGRAAWLVSWEWVGDHAAVDPPVAAVLAVQLGPDAVRQFVERLYAARSFTPQEMLAALPPHGHNPYPASFGSINVSDGDQAVRAPYLGQILCGHNPHLCARQVTRLRVGSGTYGDGSPRLEWVDRTRPDGHRLSNLRHAAPLEAPDR